MIARPWRRHKIKTSHLSRLVLSFAATTLAALSLASDALAGSGSYGLAPPPPGGGHFGGTAIASHGNLLVAVDAVHPMNFIPNQASVLDTTTGEVTLEIGPAGSSTYGSGDGQLQSPGDVDMDSAGNIWIADTGNSRIQAFRPDGSFLTKFGTRGTATGQFVSPSGITLDSADNVYVADSGNHRIQKFAPNGAFMTEWGGFGSAPGQFDDPTGIDVGPAGEVFVVDRGNGRIQEFTAAGAFVREFGGFSFSPAAPIAMGPDGTVFFVDASHTIQHFSSLGEPIGEFSCAGSEPGQINGSGIAVDDTGAVWVSEVELYDGGFHGQLIEARRLQRFREQGEPLPCKPLEVTAEKRQSLRQLAVKISCPERPCELTLSGKIRVKRHKAALRTIGSTFDADAAEVVHLRLRRTRQQNRLERLLAGRLNPKRQTNVTVKVVAATDSENETATQKVSFHLRRAR